MLQAPGLDDPSFDPFSFHQVGLVASKVDVSRREIVQALMISLMIVIADEGPDLQFEVTW